MNYEGRQQLRKAIDQAKRAQLNAAGGYKATEAKEAQLKQHVKQLAAIPHEPELLDRIEQLERERDILQQRLRRERARTSRNPTVREKELQRRLHNYRTELWKARKTRDLWYTRATGNPASKGRGATKNRAAA